MRYCSASLDSKISLLRQLHRANKRADYRGLAEASRALTRSARDAAKRDGYRRNVSVYSEENVEKSKGQWKVEVHNIRPEVFGRKAGEDHRDLHEKIAIDAMNMGKFEREIQTALQKCYEKVASKTVEKEGRKHSFQLGDYKIHCTIEMEKSPVEKSK